MQDKIKPLMIAASTVLFVVGLAGIPGEFITWLHWLNAVGSEAGRWLFVIGGMTLLAIASDWHLKAWQRIRPYFVERRMSRRQLKRECAQLSQDILRFIAERQENDPTEGQWYEMTRTTDETERRAAWDRHTQAVVAYSNETRNEYAQRFGAKVTWLAAELNRRNVPDHGLSNHGLEFVVNAIQMGMIANSLGATAHSL